MSGTAKLNCNRKKPLFEISESTDKIRGKIQDKGRSDIILGFLSHTEKGTEDIQKKSTNLPG